VRPKRGGSKSWIVKAPARCIVRRTYQIIPHWYIGVPGKSGVCGVQISYMKPEQEGIAKKIAGSIAAAS
jgi:hypothetical protein